MDATILGPFDLSDLFGGGAPPPSTSLLREAAVARLQDVAQAFHAPFPFKVGDLITPRADAPIKGAGEPHLVVEVNPNAEALVDEEFGASTYGARPTIRSLHLSNDKVVAHWSEHWFFVPWTEDLAFAAQAKREAAFAPQRADA